MRLMRQFFFTIFLVAVFLMPWQLSAMSTETDLIEDESSTSADVGKGMEPDQYFIGTVVEVSEGVGESITGLPGETFQRVQVRLNSKFGDEETVAAEYNDLANSKKDDLEVGDKVIVLRTQAFVGETRFIIADRYRIPAMAILAMAFFAVATIFAGRRGLTALLGLSFSLTLLLFYTVPAIAAGGSPFFIASLSSILIAVVSLTVAHGLSKQTGLALVSTLVTLILSLGLSRIFVDVAKLIGLGSENVFYLQFSGFDKIDLQGLLLAGIVIGVLGVLDDVTTTQTAAVKEIAAASLGVKFRALYRQGIAVGREHITSLINTLALAYAGVSLPLLLIFSTNEDRVPTWLILNGEMVAEEIVRTLIGSTVLVLAVPISTAVAAWFYYRK